MCKLIEADFSGIEAVKVGYFSGDPDYIRLAKLGIHAYVQTHILFAEKLIPEPANLKWDNDTLKRFFKEMKERFQHQYDLAKRVVHGRNYGLTEFGMSDNWPELFPRRGDARKIIDIYEAVCPKLKPWQERTCLTAHEKQFLGGPSPNRGGSPTARYHEMILGAYHPYGYRCEFYGVINYRKNAKGEWVPGRGEDAKKAISYFPQSSAAGRLCEAELILFDPESPEYIGDVYFGKTPLRAPIHDSLFLEVPDKKVDFVLERLYRVMTRQSEYLPLPETWGMGEYLTIGVSVEMGKNWAPHSEKNPEGMKKINTDDLAADVYRDEEEEEEEAMA